jgi:hypothetical protein
MRTFVPDGGSQCTSLCPFAEMGSVWEKSSVSSKLPMVEIRFDISCGIPETKQWDNEMVTAFTFTFRHKQSATYRALLTCYRAATDFDRRPIRQLELSVGRRYGSCSWYADRTTQLVRYQTLAAWKSDRWQRRRATYPETCIPGNEQSPYRDAQVESHAAVQLDLTRYANCSAVLRRKRRKVMFLASARSGCVRPKNHLDSIAIVSQHGTLIHTSSRWC